MDTSATHTPGPWRIESRLGGFDIIGPNNEDLAYVNVSDGLDEPTIYPCKANARLIAAAPTQNDALAAAVATIERDRLLWSGFPQQRKDDWELMLSAMKAAIKKTRGEQP